MGTEQSARLDYPAPDTSLVGINGQRYRKSFPDPGIIYALAGGTDYEFEAPYLWAIVTTLRPTRVLELGTRRGISARVIIEALATLKKPTRFWSCDPVDHRADADFPTDFEFFHMTGEQLYADTGGAQGLPFELIHVDTDPHSHDQTIGWLQTWVNYRLGRPGAAVFHDWRQAGISGAVKEWCEGRTGVILEEIPTENGLGVLWLTL